MTHPHRLFSSHTLRLLLGATLMVAVAFPRGVIAQGLPADYARAEAISRDFNWTTPFDGLAIGIPDTPHWIEGTHTFWYRVSTTGGFRFVRVDADSAEKAPAFDHERLAASLSAAAGENYTAVTLPFSRFRPMGEFEAIEFEMEARSAEWLGWWLATGTWRCSLSDYRCAQAGNEPGAGRGEGATSDPQPEAARSPDGRWEALVRDHNVAIRRVGSSEIRALSTDGSDGDQYELGTFSWSPDSKKLAAYRVKPGTQWTWHYIESSPEDQILPKHFSVVRDADPRDPGTVFEVKMPVLFDIETGAQVVVDRTLFSNSAPATVSALRWSEDSRAFSFECTTWRRSVASASEGSVFRIIEVDGATGMARALLETEWNGSASPFYLYRTENDKEFIWLSGRDGWRHLYLYDGLTGEVKNQITQGEWPVRWVDYVDEENRQIWFRASGMHADQDPYFMHYFRVGFDGAGLTEFTEANGTHMATWSSDREFYVDTWSRIDAPPVSVLRRTSDQSVVIELERADISALIAQGWRAPESFVAKGRDGVTDIWGIIIRPSNFDPSRSYPVIEYIYDYREPDVPKGFEFRYVAGRRFWGSPRGRDQLNRFGGILRDMMAFAELGFIVVKIDGMGHRGRSEASRDNRWDNGFRDRIPWHQAVAERYAYYDITRVGITGQSAGGRQSLFGMLFYPEFYDVAVSWAGGHWPGRGWGYRPGEPSTLQNAWRLQGRLLLGVGELDTNVHPSNTFKLVDALIDANKVFDLIVVPGAGHSDAWSSPYAWRRGWDFFVEHLLGVEPPNRNAIEAGGR